jgi:hypothetical protein
VFTPTLRMQGRTAGIRPCRFSDFSAWKLEPWTYSQ